MMTRSMSTDIRVLRSTDAEALAAFFEVVGADEETSVFFHPHPFDCLTANWISGGGGTRRDQYFAAFDREDIVGYGMLRGWDEGYEVPSFGVYVAPMSRGRGIGARLLDYAIELAAGLGAHEIMLKVYETNASARRLYEGRGFVFAERTMDGRQFVGRLRLEG